MKGRLMKGRVGQLMTVITEHFDKRFICPVNVEIVCTRLHDGSASFAAILKCGSPHFTYLNSKNGADSAWLALKGLAQKLEIDSGLIRSIESQGNSKETQRKLPLTKLES